MKPIPALFALVAAAVWIWLRDRSWLADPMEVLPVLIGLPLLVWLGWPWPLRTEPARTPRRWLMATAALTAGGVVFSLPVLLAAAWTCAFAALGHRWLAPEALTGFRRLLPLALLAFPWLALDAGGTGWWFRLTAAASVERAFSLLGLAVERNGTLLTIQGMPFSVEPACAGLKVLQSLLLCGCAVAWLQIGRHRSYWASLPLLFVLAWLANTGRVMLLCSAALTAGPAFASGPFHAWGGWMIFVLMFALSYSFFSLWRKLVERTPVLAGPGAQPSLT